MPYEIELTKSAKAQLRHLTARSRSILLTAIKAQLPHEPLVETRNRKRLRPNPFAPWELRVGDLRVFYEVAEEGAKRVYIVAVGEKRGNSLWIGGEEVKL
jgi:mRNA-degrading endonuclease RelE of RelBE toxin-antitoxin system